MNDHFISLQLYIPLGMALVGATNLLDNATKPARHVLCSRKRQRGHQSIGVHGPEFVCLKENEKDKGGGGSLFGVEVYIFCMKSLESPFPFIISSTPLEDASDEGTGCECNYHLSALVPVPGCKLLTDASVEVKYVHGHAAADPAWRGNVHLQQPHASPLDVDAVELAQVHVLLHSCQQPQDGCTICHAIDFDNSRT
jgi:hypothetical protein